MTKQFEMMPFEITHFQGKKELHLLVQGYKLSNAPLAYYKDGDMFRAIHLPTGLGLLTYRCKVTEVKNFLKGLGSLPVNWNDVTATNCTKLVMSNGVRLYDAMLEVKANTIN